MTDMTLREQMYRRWKKGEDYCVLAKEMRAMSDEKLIDALRRMSPRLDMLDCESVLTAADRIEAQAAEIEKLKGDLRQAKISEVFWRDGWHALDQDKRAVEAKLAKAVRLLRQHCYPLDMPDEDAATLAALTGAKP